MKKSTRTHALTFPSSTFLKPRRIPRGCEGQGRGGRRLSHLLPPLHAQPDTARGEPRVAPRVVLPPGPASVAHDQEDHRGGRRGVLRPVRRPRLRALLGVHPLHGLLLPVHHTRVEQGVFRLHLRAGRVGALHRVRPVDRAILRAGLRPVRNPAPRGRPRDSRVHVLRPRRSPDLPRREEGVRVEVPAERDVHQDVQLLNGAEVT